jgi:Bacterial SH3 domain
VRRGPSQGRNSPQKAKYSSGLDDCQRPLRAGTERATTIGMKNLIRLLAGLALASFAACAPQTDAAEVDPEDDTQSIAEDLTGNFPVGTAFTTTADVNLRRGPSKSDAIIKLIPSGSVVKSASASARGVWYGVSFQGDTGWVHGSFIKKGASSPSETPSGGHFTRQAVYNAVKSRVQPGCSGDPADFLSSSLTTQQLVDAVGYINANANFSWGWCVANSGHHFDPQAHSSGLSIDIFATEAGNDRAMMKLINQDPYFVEVGVSGDYRSLQGLINAPGKCSFVENAPTHIHASVKKAFCN